MVLGWYQLENMFLIKYFCQIKLIAKYKICQKNLTGCYDVMYNVLCIIKVATGQPIFKKEILMTYFFNLLIRLPHHISILNHISPYRRVINPLTISKI